MIFIIIIIFNNITLIYIFFKQHLIEIYFVYFIFLSENLIMLSYLLLLLLFLLLKILI